MVVTSPAPSGLSNRHRSTAVAFSEKSVKLTPAPSQMAPCGYGCPGHTFMTFCLSSVAPLSSQEEETTPPLKAGRSALRGGFHPAPEHFRHTPGLRDTPPRRERLLSIEDLADRPESCLIQLRDKTREKLARSSPVLGVHPQPCIDKG